MYQYLKTLKLLPLVVFLLCMSLVKQCKDGNFMSNELMIHQTLIEVSSTEAWIDISIPAPTKTIPVIMKRNGIPIRDFQLNTRTVFSDSGLTPGERYDYQVFSEDIQISPIVSNLVSATTLDTTSHDIHWTVYQFGNAPSSSLNDIWIDNDIIFAGGKIWQGNFQDTSQNVLDQFSGVYGNNQTLDLLQIIYQFPSYKSILNIYGIWKNNTGSYWLTAGNIYKWDGTDNIELSYQRDISTSQIALVLWGLSDSLMYSGGTEGLLLKYQHNRWTNLNMNSDSYSTDIWGCVDEEYRAPIVYATIWSPEIGSVNELLRIYPDNSVGIIDLRPFVNEVVPYSVWFKNKNIIYVAGNRLF